MITLTPVFPYPKPLIWHKSWEFLMGAKKPPHQSSTKLVANNLSQGWIVRSKTQDNSRGVASLN